MRREIISEDEYIDWPDEADKEGNRMKSFLMKVALLLNILLVITVVVIMAGNGINGMQAGEMLVVMLLCFVPLFNVFAILAPSE